MMCSRRSQSLNKEDRGVGLGNSPFVRLMFKVVRSHSLGGFWKSALHKSMSGECQKAERAPAPAPCLLVHSFTISGLKDAVTGTSGKLMSVTPRYVTSATPS